MSQMNMGDTVELAIDHATGKVTASKDGKDHRRKRTEEPVLLDEVRAGGRIP